MELLFPLFPLLHWLSPRALWDFRQLHRTCFAQTSQGRKVTQNHVVVVHRPPRWAAELSVGQHSLRGAAGQMHAVDPRDLPSRAPDPAASRPSDMTHQVHLLPSASQR